MADAATAPVSPYGYSSPQQVQLLSSTYLRDFQEPFRFYLNPSLSELQSWRSSISSTSSGMPGPGHLSGKAIEWVGERILDAITPLEIRRRIWLIKRFVGRLEKEPEGTRWKWLLKKQKSFPRLANDLLELSSDAYGPKYRELSIGHGYRINSALAQVDYHNEGTYWLLSVRICPLLFIGEDRDSYDSISTDICKILQKRREPSDIDGMISGLVARACYELTQSPFTKSRRNAYELIHQLSFVPEGACELEKLGELLDDLAKKVFDSGFASEHFKEQWCGIMFFVEYAHKHEAYRDYVLNGLGLYSQVKIFGPANGQKLPASTDWDRIRWPCKVIGRICDMPWIIPTLLGLDICNAMISLLRSHNLSGRPDARIDYSIIRAFYNLVSFGNHSARQAVQDTLTGEVLDDMYILSEGRWEVPRMANDVQKWMRGISRGGEEKTDGKLSNERKVTFDLRFRIPEFAL